MRHTTIYHLRALLRPLKRRALPRSNAKGKGRVTVPCSHQSHAGYDPLLPDSDDEEYQGEAIELLPPARIVTDPCLLVRPISAPGPSSLTPPSSPWMTRPSHFSSSSAASTCTLASSSSTSQTYTDRPVSAVECGNASKNRSKSRRQTWTKSFLALDHSLFFVTDDDDPHMAAKVDAVAADQRLKSVRESKRDSFMWMKFDGHTGGAVAWADGARLAGALGV